MTARGELNHQAKLTETQVKEMRFRRDRYGTPWYRLAEQYGCSINAIRKAVAYETWKHV